MLSKDFKELLGLFNAKGIEYLIVGGYALAMHGHPRYTGDIDLWVFSDPGNAARISESLDEFGFNAVGLTVADFLKPNSVIQLGYPPSRVDILTSVDGLAFTEAWPRRLLVSVDGLMLPVISREDLITNKQASGRLQDKADLEKLLSAEGD